jgi:hypothetical protein
VLAALTNMTREEAQALGEQFRSEGQAEPRAQAKQFVADGWAVVKGRPGAQEFANWVLQGARAAALTRTGGFLGIGGEAEVDPQEQVALDELATVLTI